MREGPQLGVDAYGVRRYGSVIQVCEQPCATLTLQAFAKTIILGRRLLQYKILFSAIVIPATEPESPSRF